MRWVKGLFLILAVGCSAVTDFDREVLVRATRSDYTVGEAITVRILNRTATDVYVAHCNHRASMQLDRRVGGEWEEYRQVSGPYCLGIYPAGELRIAPGRELAESLVIEDAGEFRLQLYARRAHEDLGSLVVVSPHFTVRYPPD